MFRYSLVYAIRDKEHGLSKRICHYASELGLNAFTPHVTILHSLSFDHAKHLLSIFDTKYDVPEFRPLSSVSVTCTPLVTANGKKVLFYAVEQPILTNEKQVMNMHLSLAYKVGTPFTLSELDKIKPYNGLLRANDLQLCIHSCHAKSPSFWKRVL